MSFAAADVVTFKTTRGSFTIPAELFEDGREHELARHYAMSMPPACTTVSRKHGRDGTVVVTWRKVRVVPYVEPRA